MLWLLYCLQQIAVAGIALAIASAVRGCVDGRRLRQRLRGRLCLQRTVAGCSSIAGTARCGTTLEDNTSDKLVCWFNGGGFIPVEATREVDLRWWFLLFDGDLGGWGIPTHYFDGNL
jgi:hypothetical protein